MFMIGFVVIQIDWGFTHSQIFASALQYCPPSEYTKSNKSFLLSFIYNISLNLGIIGAKFFKSVQDEGMYFKASTAYINLLNDQIIDSFCLRLQLLPKMRANKLSMVAKLATVEVFFLHLFCSHYWNVKIVKLFLLWWNVKECMKNNISMMATKLF